MIADKSLPVRPPATDNARTAFAIEQVRRWSEVVEQFVQWQAERIRRGTPSAQQAEDHRRDLKWMMRLTRLISSVAADPEFPDKALASQLEAQVVQLQESWEQLYNPMPAEEAEKILSEFFPDER